MTSFYGFGRFTVQNTNPYPSILSRWRGRLRKDLYPSRCERRNIRLMNGKFCKSNIDGLVAGFSSSNGPPRLAEESAIGERYKARQIWCEAATPAPLLTREVTTNKRKVRNSASSAHSAGLTHCVKINHLIYVTLLQTGTRKRNFWKKLKKRLWRRRKIRASTEILVYLLIARFTKQNQFSPDFKEPAE